MKASKPYPVVLSIDENKVELRTDFIEGTSGDPHNLAEIAIGSEENSEGAHQIWLLHEMLDALREQPGIIPHSSLKKLGEKLFQALLGGERNSGKWQEIINTARIEGQRPIQLCIDVTANEFRNLPYHLLRNPVEAYFLFHSASPPIRLIRVIRECSRRILTFHQQDRLRLLLLISSPEQEPIHGISLKAHTICHDFRQLAETTGIDVFVCSEQDGLHHISKCDPDDFLPYCRITKSLFRKALKQADFDIVHILAHGYGNGLLLRGEKGSFGDEELSSEDLGALVRQHGHLQMVFLQVCRASETKTRGGFGGVAQQLLNRHHGDLAAVIASPYKVDLDTSLLVADRFYKELAEDKAHPDVALHKSLDLAEEQWSRAPFEIWMRPEKDYSTSLSSRTTHIDLRSIVSRRSSRKESLSFEDVVNLSMGPDDVFRNTISRAGINFLFTDEVRWLLYDIGIPAEKIDYIKQEIVPLVFITEGVGEDCIQYSIANANPSTEIRISQIEVEPFMYKHRVIYPAAIVERLQTRELMLSESSTTLLDENTIISLKPGETQAFSTSVSINNDTSGVILDALSYFRFKITFFKSNERRLKHAYSDVVFRFSDRNEIKCFTQEEIYACLYDGCDSLEWLNIEALHNIPDTKFLLFALQDENWRVRCQAIDYLEEEEAFDAVEPFIAALADENSSVQERAVQALLRIGDLRAIEPFFTLLNSNEEGCKLATEMLTWIGSIKGIDPLLALLSDEVLMCEVAGVLGQLRNPAAVIPLIEVLTDKNKDKNSRIAAAQALVAIEDARVLHPFLQILLNENDDASLRREVVMALRKMNRIGVEIVDENTLQLFLKILADKTEDVALRREVVITLGRMNLTTSGLGHDKTLQLFLRILADCNEDTDLGQKVIIALGERGSTDSEIFEILLQVLVHEKYEIAVRREVAKRLRFIGNARAVEPLLNVLEKDTEDTELRNQVVLALGMIGDERAVSPLLQALKAARSGRSVIIQALGRIGDSRAIEALTEFLQNPDLYLQETTKEALKKIKRKNNIPS